MRMPIAAGNWKMNYGPSQAGQFATLLRDPLNAISGVEKILFPPAISLSAVQNTIANTTIQLGAQNMSDQPGGAFTGDISATMIAELCQWVLVGHSERRMYAGESNELVNRKAKLALNTQLSTIICVGEQLEERDEERTNEVLSTQIHGSIANIPTDQLGRVVVAYEPVWAIGTGRASSFEDAEVTITFIRSLISEMYGATVAEAMRILYGGSVTAANIGDYVASLQIDGALVGGASLKPEFVDITKAIASAKAP